MKSQSWNRALNLPKKSKINKEYAQLVLSAMQLFLERMESRADR